MLDEVLVKSGLALLVSPSSSPVMQYPSLSPSAKICTNCGALQWPIHCNLQLSVRFAIAHRDCMTGPEGLPAPACTRNAEWKLMLFAAPRVGQSSNGSSGGPLGTRKPRSFLPCLMQLPLVRIHPCTSGVESSMELPPEQFSSAFRCTEGAWHSTAPLATFNAPAHAWNMEHLSVESSRQQTCSSSSLNWPGTPAHCGN
jgi:hypothetical protein